MRTIDVLCIVEPERLFQEVRAFHLAARCGLLQRSGDAKCLVKG